MSLDSNQLRLLLTVRETGSLVKTAGALGVTPSAVSQQLARLERQTGAALVERSSSGARLTRLGTTLAEHGERVLSELANADDAVAGFLGLHTRRLRIGAFPSGAVSLLPAVLAPLRRDHPNADLSVIDIQSDSGPGLVAEGTLDVALTAQYTQAVPGINGVRLNHLLSEPLYAVFPRNHPIARKAAGGVVDLRHLRHEAWACGIEGRPARSQLEAAAEALGFRPRVPFQTESYDVAQAIAASGEAVAFIPRLALLRNDSTSIRPLKPALTREVYAAVPSDVTHLALAHQFLNELQSVCLPFRYRIERSVDPDPGS